MTYNYRCHVCEETFLSFEELTRHKQSELDRIAEIKGAHPEWDLRQCFAQLRPVVDAGLNSGGNASPSTC